MRQSSASEIKISVQQNARCKIELYAFVQVGRKKIEAPQISKNHKLSQSAAQVPRTKHQHRNIIKLVRINLGNTINGFIIGRLEE